jgi:hypothetical protein
MKTTTKLAGVLAIVCGASFVLLAGDAQAGCRSRGWGGYRYVARPYIVIRPCHDYHYGFCPYHKRYGFCRYFVPGPVGAPPVIGTLPAPAPGGPAVGQPAPAQNAGAGVTNPTTAQATATTGNTDSSTKIDAAQIAAIVTAVEKAMAKPEAVVESPKVAPELLKALDQLITQRLAEATKATPIDAAPLPEAKPTAQESESKSGDLDLEALRAMLAQLLAEQQTAK